MREIRYIFLFVMLNLFQHLNAQQNKIDSLLTLLKTDKEDTNKVKHLNALSVQYRLIGEYDRGLTYGKQSLELAHSLNFKRGLATSYNSVGIIYDNLGNLPDALTSFFPP